MPQVLIGIQPSHIVGKVINRFRKSPVHPTVTIEFADGSSAQIRVDGYDPQYPGIPKLLEMDSTLQELVSNSQPVNVKILDCTFVTLSDKAFQKSKKRDGEVVSQHWDQQHRALAFKFANGSEGRAKWHCIWASLQERDAVNGDFVFRSYEDVYLEQLPGRKPSKQAKRLSRLPPSSPPKLG